MEPIKYTLNLDDCHDFVVYQNKIPRIKKYVIKQSMPVIIILSVILVFIFGFGIFDFFRTLADVHMKYSMSYVDIFTSSLMLPFVIDSLKLFFFINFPVLFFVLLFVLYCILGVRYDVFKLNAKRVFTLLQGSDLDLEIVLNSEGIECRGKNSSNCYNWAKIIDIYDTGKSFLVFVSDYMAEIIPRRAFANEDAAMEFYNTMKNNLNRE